MFFYKEEAQEQRRDKIFKRATSVNVVGDSCLFSFY
jgi:hypothetical protein